MSPCRVVRYPGARAFLDATEPFLCRSEVENNLMLGIAREIRDGGGAPGEAEYFAAVLGGDQLLGCAFRTIPSKVGITRIVEAEAIAALAADVASACADASEVGGPEPTVAAFARLVAVPSGRRPERWMTQRIHELSAVTLPDRPAPGRLRLADEAEIDPLTPWVGEMLVLTGDQRRAGEIARDRVTSRHLFVWDDDGPVSMAAWTGKTINGVRVNFVYTPPEHRGRGYATTCVAELSQHLLDQGNSYCCLYTDLTNPTSNAIYRRIGYRPVCDAAVYALRDPLISA